MSNNTALTKKYNHQMFKNLSEYRQMWEKSILYPEDFWKEIAQEQLSWKKNFEEILSNKKNNYRWFEGGKLNACYNCLDVNIPLYGEKTALICENEKCKF